MFDWPFVWKILPELLRGLGVTLQATLLGFLLAMMLGLVWAVLRRSHNPLISWTTAFWVEFIRSTPLLVQIYFLFYVFPQWDITMSPLKTGILAIGLHYSAYTSEVYRAGIEGVPKGQWEASIALDLSPYRTWRSVILPQAIPPVIPALGNYLVAMFKDTPMLSAITVLEVLQRAKLIGADTFRYLEPLTLAGVFFLVLSLLSSQFIRRMEKRYARVQ